MKITMSASTLRLYFATVLITFVIAVLWEFNIQHLLVDPFESTEERWKYVITSVLFVMLALIIPTWIAAKREAERDESEESLRINETRLLEATEVGKVGVWDWNPITGELIWTDETYRILGFSSGEVTPSYELFLDVVHPEDREFLEKSVNDALHKKKPYSLDCRILARDGVKRVANVVGEVRFDENGNPIRMLGTFIDITERKKIEEMFKKFSFEDALTGVANRRTFDNVLKREWNRAQRYKSPISMIMLDLDYFKNYNDHYGHQEGDKCLQKVANIMKNVLHRSSDFIARYGGEEFSVILPTTDKNSALEIAENLRKSIESQKIPHEKSEAGDFLTVSLGVSTVIPVKSMSLDMIVKQADGCLYSAKREGRNRVVELEADLSTL